MWDQIVSVPDHCLSLYSVEFPETRHFFLCVALFTSSIQSNHMFN